MFRMLHLSEMVGVEPRIHQGYVPEFLSVLREARTGKQLVETVTKIVREIGFETFVYGSLFPNERNDPDVVVVTTMPYEWVARYDRKSYIEVDPRIQYCLRHVTPFLWDSKHHYGRWIQLVNATRSLNISAGVWKASVLRGLWFNCLAIA